jgi:hypothetical protein
MFALKTGILAVALSAVGLFTAAPAHAQAYVYGPGQVIVRDHRMARYAPSWYRRHWMRRPFYLQPGYTVDYATPSYVVAPPVYPQPPVYAQPIQDNGCGAFSAQIRGELANVEAAVRDRVAAGELDGDALTAMESARDDIDEDVVDVSAKGYITPADRAHIEDDIRRLRARFGC